ncbi:MAG: hypothetical protein ABGY71_09200 [bacterium]|jgi:hypothetical protein|nr:hypothetical protein [Planctomycetota bacterium]HIL52730.1 hypothetical protein [Planctomycetota bacterium]
MRPFLPNSAALKYALAPFIALGLAWSGASVQDSAVQKISAAAQEILLASPEELLAHPDRFLGNRVQITVQMHSYQESWNPFLTRFGPREFVCLRGWSDAQFPWLRGDFEQPLMRVFARRGSAAEWALADAKRYQRFELTCAVRAVFGGQPWLEVSAVKPLARNLGTGCVLHAARGLEFMEKGLWQAARLEFERATAGALPRVAREELQRLIALATR